MPGHLRNLVAAHLKISPEELQPEIELGRDLCMDSLAAAELLVVIEEDMHIELLADVLAERDRVTYGDLERFVSERFDAAG